MDSGDWIKPGVRVTDSRYRTTGTVVGIWNGSPWVAWDLEGVAGKGGRVYTARRAPWKHLRPGLALVKGLKDGN